MFYLVIDMKELSALPTVSVRGIEVEVLSDEEFEIEDTWFLSANDHAEVTISDADEVVEMVA